jgi:hypothetical protein
MTMPRPRNGAAQVPGELLWRAIIDLRGHRDTIEISVDRLTEALDLLARRTGLTAAIEADWDPDSPAPPASAPATGKGEVEDLVERAKAGLSALRTLWNSSASMPAERPDAVFAFGASMEFVTDSIEALLDEIAATAAPGGKRSGDSAAAPPT